MFKRMIKWATPILIFAIICFCLYSKFDTINLVTECEDVTEFSSPFETAESNTMQTKQNMRALNMLILSKKVPQASTREVVYQVNIHSKGGHTEEIISYGERLLHYYDRQCLGEYYVPLISRLYLYYIYGGIG